MFLLYLMEINVKVFLIFLKKKKKKRLKGFPTTDIAKLKYDVWICII